MVEPPKNAKDAEADKSSRSWGLPCGLWVLLRLTSFCSFGTFLVALLFAGALLWAKGRDPF
jgi:hypothetical protein